MVPAPSTAVRSEESQSLNARLARLQLGWVPV